MRRLFRVRWRDGGGFPHYASLLTSATLTDTHFVGVTLDGRGWVEDLSDMHDIQIEVESYG